MDFEKIRARLDKLVAEGRKGELRGALSMLNEVDIAEFLDELDVEQEILVFRLLPKDTAAEVFTYLENTEDQEKLIGALSDRELREVLDELYLDDTVDIIEDMPANVVSRILRNTDASTRSQINQLLNYPKDSAGSIMTTEFVFLHPDATVEESFARIRSVGIDKETIYTCYVTQNRVLLGVVTVRRMLLSSYETRIRDIMETNVLSVNTHEDKEDVAQLLNKYDLWSRYEPEDKAVAICYASMYGNTENAANLLANGLAEAGVKNIAVYDVSSTHVSTLISEVFRCSHIVLACPTYNNSIYPAMYNFIHDMEALLVQNRTVGIIQNGTWNPASGKLIQAELESMKNITLLEPVVTVKSSLKEDSKAQLDALKDAIVESLKG